MRRFGAVCCHFANDRVKGYLISLSRADLSYLRQHASNLLFPFFVNLRQSVTKYYGNFQVLLIDPQHC